ncbi:hypothetical protein RFI_23585, partial [Reticulomyxa filosa]
RVLECVAYEFDEPVVIVIVVVVVDNDSDGGDDDDDDDDNDVHVKAIVAIELVIERGRPASSSSSSSSSSNLSKGMASTMSVSNNDRGGVVGGSTLLGPTNPITTTLTGWNINSFSANPSTPSSGGGSGGGGGGGGTNYNLVNNNRNTLDVSVGIVKDIALDLRRHGGGGTYIPIPLDRFVNVAKILLARSNYRKK